MMTRIAVLLAVCVYLQVSSSSPLSAKMSIRPLICVDQSNQSGICMFSMDCRRLNGTALGVCGDRFFFGSCCVIPEMKKEQEEWGRLQQLIRQKKIV